MLPSRRNLVFIVQVLFILCLFSAQMLVRTSSRSTTALSADSTILPLRVLQLSVISKSGIADSGKTVVDTLILGITNDGNASLTIYGLVLPDGFTGNFAGVVAPGKTRMITLMAVKNSKASPCREIRVKANQTSGSPVICSSGTDGSLPGRKGGPSMSRKAGMTATKPLPRPDGWKINIRDRQEARKYYHYFIAVPLPELRWNGQLEECKAGITPEVVKEVQLRRVNYFRAMAGVSGDITFLEDYNRKAQKAALIMACNGDITHYPPEDWKCLSYDGSLAARSSNLAISSDIDAISGYIEDDGLHNGSVGHRRWILYPPIMKMGTGCAIGKYEETKMVFNALWVMDSTISDPARPKTREEFVAWPPPGYVPYQIVYPRWSFHYDQADFSQTEISVISGGMVIPVYIEHRTTNAEGMYVGDNAIVWRMPLPGVIPLNKDKIYTVEVRKVKIVGQLRDFKYEVIVFNPS